MNKKLGYYVTDGKEFFSKVQAALYATQRDSSIAWHFNNEVFDRFAWHQEPEQSLDQLYDRRAREIREKYDYVILNYSGGSDSHNILMSFYRQGLRLDEIITNWIFEASKKFTINSHTVKEAWNSQAEFELHTRAKLEWIKNNMPQTKITFNDLSKNIFNYFTKNKDESWVLNGVDAFNPTAYTRYNSLDIKEVRTQFDQLKNIGVLTGNDKPKCKMKNNKLYLTFHDKVANITPIAQHFGEYDNSTIEYFYWSPDCCEMLAKQAHAILKFANTNPSYRKIWEQGYMVSRNTQEAIVKEIVYTTWDNTNWQSDKASLDWYSELDFWFIDQFSDIKTGQNWLNGIRYLEKNIDKRFLKSLGQAVYAPDSLGLQADQAIGLSLFTTPDYYIGDLSN